MRTVCFAVGVVCVGVGVAALLRSGVGVAPLDVVNSGLAARTGWGVGTASWCVAAALLAAAWLAGRRPRLGTVVSAFAIGAVINVAFAAIPAADVPATQVLLAAAAFTAAWSGIVALVCADFGAGPSEELMLALVARSWPLREVRWGIEAALFAVGWALGGAIGVGTAVFVAATGPVLAWAVPRTARRLGVTLAPLGHDTPREIR